MVRKWFSRSFTLHCRYSKIGRRGGGVHQAWRCAGKTCQMAYKPGSVALLPALMAIHLARLLPAVSSDLPEHDAGSHLNGAPFACPYLVLLRMGFAMPVLLPGRRCALTAPFHPYHGRQRDRRWRYFFCGTFPRVTPAGCYPAS